MAEQIKESKAARAGIQSVEVAARLLVALTRAPAPMALKPLAAAAGMSMSKAHRYLVSLCRTGLVEQDPISGRYDLGRLALGMGLTALERVDALRLALASLPELRDRVNETAVLAVWGEHGPTVIRFEESSRPVRMNVRVGSVLPVTASSVGQTFAAYLPEPVVREALEREAAAPGLGTDGPGGREAFAKLLAEVRRRGINRNVGAYIPGVSALAAPILNSQGQIVAVIGVLGHEVSLDTSWDGPVARILKEHAMRLSARLGHGEA